MIYLYQNPENEEEILEVYQKMEDIHEYYGEDGQKWQRVWTIPNMSMDTKVDPFSKKDFLKKSKGMKTMGEAWDLSTEMSEKREHKLGGADPIKQKASNEFYKPKK